MIDRTNLQSQIRSQLLACYAMMLKLSWLEASSAAIKSSALETIQKLLSSQELPVRLIGMNILCTLVSEFSGQMNRTTKIGQSWEFHERCRVAFQKDLLPQCFEFAINVLNDVVVKGSGGVAQTTTPTQDATILTTVANVSFKLLNEVLTWDFSPFDLRSVLRRASSKPSKKDLPAIIVTSNEYWRRALTNPSLITTVIQLHEQFRHDRLMPHLTLQSLVQLCSVSRRCFFDDQSCLQFIPHIMTGIFRLLQQPLSGNSVTAGHEIYHLALCIFRVVGNFGIGMMVQVPNCADILKHLSAVTIQVTRTSAFNYDEWYFDAMEHLLDTWSIIVSSIESSVMTIPPDAIALITNCSTSIFAAYLESRLKFGTSHTGAKSYGGGDDGDGDDEDEDDSQKLEEQLTCLGVLARQDPGQTLSMLRARLLERLNVLQQVLNSNNTAQCELLWNDLDTILQLIGYVLADDDEGETPVIPHTINLLAQSSNSAVFFDLIDSIFKYVEFESMYITNGRIDVLSPYMGQRLMWLLSRWARSYLMPNTTYYSNLSPTLVQKYGGDGGKQLIGFLLNKIILNLFKWQGEVYLASDTCSLLSTLVKNKEACKSLFTLEAWQQLMNSEKDTFTLLSSQQDEIKATVLQCLITGGTNGLGEQDLGNYLTQLLNPLRVQFLSIVDHPQFQTVYQSASVLGQISYCLEKFIGLVKASTHANVKYLFAFFATNQLFEKLAALTDKYHNYSNIINLILQFFDECVKNQIVHLSIAESKHMCQACLAVMETYRKYNAGRTFTGSSLESNAEEEQFQDVLTLISIGTHVVSKDFLDFAGPDQSDTADLIDISMVVFQGLNLILPLITQDMLQFPKLCMQYFTLVTFMFEMYPEKAAQLPPALFQQLISSIVYGTKHHKAKISRLSFEALRSMAMRNVQQNREIFQQQEVQNPTFVSYLLENVFSLLLFEAFSDDMVEAAAEALLPLILWDEDKFKQMVNKLVQGESGSPERQQRLLAAFSVLFEGVNPQEKTSRANEKKFLENLEKFLLTVRTFMRKN